MDLEAVEEYVERSQQLLDASPQMNEQNTKVRLVQPFLELLGWDLYSTEVEHEYTIPMASGSTHVDYALLVGDSPVVFVEAKPASSDLSSQYVQQLQSYMRQELHVDWGILTNGKEFEVLTKSQQRTDGEEVSVARFALDDLGDNPEVIELLSKEAIRSGKADEVAAQVARTNEAIRHLTENEEDVTDAIRSTIEAELGDIPMDLDEQAREFVQSLHSALREQRQFVTESDPVEPDDPPTIPPDENDSEVENFTLHRDLLEETISRADLKGDENETVAVYASRPSGLRFLKENAAWGFVRVGRPFDYIAMYITDDESAVRYFAEVDEVVDPAEADLARDPLDYLDRDEVGEGKKVIQFKRDTFYELADSIPYESKWVQSRRDTTLGKLRAADTTDDLF